MSLKKLALCALVALTLAACGEEDTNTNNPAVTAGKALWDANACAGCHGANGKGTAAGADLTAAAITGLSDDTLKGSIKNGKGNNMPAYGTLTDEQLSNLVTYIRSL